MVLTKPHNHYKIYNKFKSLSKSNKTWAVKGNNNRNITYTYKVRYIKSCKGVLKEDFFAGLLILSKTRSVPNGKKLPKRSVPIGNKGGEKMNIIEVKNLNKRFTVKQKEKGIKGSIKSIIKPKYKKIKAVNNISFTVEKGEMLAFIGPNGAGKSTTIKMLTGILYPTSGEIMVNGINPAKQRKKLAYKIGTVFGQKEQLWTHLTPYDNFKFFGAIYDIPNDEIEDRIEELSNTFELQEFINTPVRNLSLGQRIRCEMVAALIHKPEILFLDEPTIGLDPVVKKNIRNLIKKMNKELGTTIFLTSHDVGDIEKLCKRVIIINKGKIIMDDTMQNLKSNKPLEDIITEIYQEATIWEIFWDKKETSQNVQKGGKNNAKILLHI